MGTDVAEFTAHIFVVVGDLEAANFSPLPQRTVIEPLAGTNEDDIARLTEAGSYSLSQCLGAKNTQLNWQHELEIRMALSKALPTH